MMLFSESVAVKKTARFCREFAFFFLFFFSSVYFLCVEILILKQFLSHAHKWLTFDVISRNLFVSSHELVVGPGMVNW